MMLRKCPDRGWVMLVIFTFLTSYLRAKITYSPEDVQACVGDEILLDWQFDNLSSNGIVHCHKNGQDDVITITSLTGARIYSKYDGRLKYGGNGNITIQNTTKEDAGVYTLEILDSGSYDADAVQVAIYDRIRSPPAIEYDSNLNILKCEFKGITTDTDDISVTLKNDSFTWHKSSITPTTSGNFTCTVSGPVIDKCLQPGVSSTSFIDLSIGKPVVRARFTVVKAAVGQSATLQCYTEVASPAVKKWSWVRAGTMSPVLSGSATLQLSYVTKEQSGQYKCVAQNVIGESDPVFVTLDVIGIGNVTKPVNIVVDDEFPILTVVLSTCATVIVVAIVIAAIILKIRRSKKKKSHKSRGMTDRLAKWLFQANNTPGYDEVSTVSGSSTNTDDTYVHYQQIRESCVASSSLSTDTFTTDETGYERVQGRDSDATQSCGTSSGYAGWSPHPE